MTTIELTPGNVKDATQGVKSADLWQVPYEQLHVIPGFNVREHDDDYEVHLANLTNLIIENGYDRTKPLSGYVALIDGQSRIVITDGHSRYIAAGRAREMGTEIVTIPVVTSPRGTSQEDLIVGLVTANSGRPLKPYEMGTVCKRLVSAGWEEAQIAKRLGITSTYVNDLLYLQSLSKALRDLVRTGKVSATLAITTAREHGSKALAVLQGAVETAEKSGKAKASAKHVAPSWKSAVKKASGEMFEALEWVQKDEGYKKLTPSTRSFIEDLLARLPPEPEASK